MTRIAIRCDGGRAAGAGHVARCLPIAEALERRGVESTFVGHFDGLADWLLTTHGVRRVLPQPHPCGLDPDHWSGAIVDLYLPTADDLCALARQLPIATIGESTRCPDLGLRVDYHPAARVSTGDQLTGAAFIPVDARFSAQSRTRESVRTVLVTVGGSDRFTHLGSELATLALERFPDASIWAPSGIAAAAPGTRPLPSMIELAVLAPEIDVAITAAGLTPYEMAAAGIPAVAIGIVENQLIVLESCAETGIALPVNGLDGDPIRAADEKLGELTSRQARRALSVRGPEVVDGLGAERVATELVRRWTRG